MSLQELRYAEHSPTEWNVGFDWSADHSNTTIGSGAPARAAPIRMPLRSGWQAQVEAKLAKLTLLQRGWDGYDAAPPSVLVTAFAMSVLNSVMKPATPAPSIVPTHGGGVQLEWHVGGLDVELMIYRPFEAELSVEFSDGQPAVEEQPLTTSFDSLGEVLEKLA
jgi:hypothetical protein